MKGSCATFTGVHSTANTGRDTVSSGEGITSKPSRSISVMHSVYRGRPFVRFDSWKMSNSQLSICTSHNADWHVWVFACRQWPTSHSHVQSGQCESAAFAEKVTGDSVCLVAKFALQEPRIHGSMQQQQLTLPTNMGHALHMLPGLQP